MATTPPDPLDDAHGRIPDEAPVTANRADQPSAAAPSADGSAKKETLLAAQQRIKQESPLQHKGILVIAGIVVIAVIIVVIMAMRPSDAAAPMPVLTKPEMSMGNDVDSRFVTFMNDVKDRLPRQATDLTDLKRQVEDIQAEVAKSLQGQAAAQGAAAEKLAKALVELQRQVEVMSKSGGATGQVAGDVEAFVTALRKQRAGSGLSLNEARMRMEQYLKNQGFSGTDLASLRDKYLDEMGFLYVGDVTEPALSDEELRVLPVGLRSVVRQLHDVNFQSAAHEGKVLYRQDDSLRWIHHQLGDTIAKSYQDTDLAKAAFLGRIRKENVKAEMEEMLPDLAASRDAAGIAPTDLFRTEAFVYEQRRRWPDMTPGQHLSLTMALGGLRANPSGTLSGRSHAPTVVDRMAILAAVKEAITLARAQGVTQQEMLLRRAAEACKVKVTDLHLDLPQTEENQLILTALAAVLRGDTPTESSRAPEAHGTAVGGPGGPTPSEAVNTPRVLRLGPVELLREQAPLAAWLVADECATRLAQDPGTPTGATAMAACWSSAAAAGAATWSAVDQRGDSLRTFANVLIGGFQTASGQATRFAKLPLVVTGLPPDEAPYAQALEIGTLIGAQQGNDFGVIEAAIRRRLATLGSDSFDAQRLAACAPAGLERFGSTWLALGLPSLPLPVERLVALHGVLARETIERRVAHAQISIGGLPETFRTKMVRDLDDDLVITVPCILASRDDGRMPMDLMQHLLVSGQQHYDVAAIAEALLSRHGVQLVAERFATLVDDDAMIPHIYHAIAAWIPDQVHAVMEEQHPAITDTTIGSVAVDCANALNEPLSQFIAKTVIRTNLVARLQVESGSLNQDGYTRAVACLDQQLASMTIDPMTIRHLDEISLQLHGQAMAELHASSKDGSSRGQRGATCAGCGAWSWRHSAGRHQGWRSPGVTHRIAGRAGGWSPCTCHTTRIRHAGLPRDRRGHRHHQGRCQQSSPAAWQRRLLRSEWQVV